MTGLCPSPSSHELRPSPLHTPYGVEDALHGPEGSAAVPNVLEQPLAYRRLTVTDRYAPDGVEDALHGSEEGAAVPNVLEELLAPHAPLVLLILATAASDLTRAFPTQSRTNHCHDRAY